MQVIDKEGNIVEGQPLTQEEVEILTALSESELNAVAGVYISSRDAKKIASHLISNYRITRREPVAEVENA